MEAIALRKLLRRDLITAVLADFARLLPSSGSLCLYDRDGRVLAAYPAPPSPEPVEAIRAVLDGSGVVPFPGGVAEPLLVQGRPIGVLVGTVVDVPPLPARKAADPPALHPLLRALAGALGQMATLALENRALALEALDRYRELNLIYRMQTELGAELDPDQIATRVLAESMRVIKATRGAILLLSQDGQSLVVQTCEGLSLERDRYPATEGLAGQALSQRRSFLINDLKRDRQQGTLEAHARSLLFVPLLVGERALGVICLFDKKGGKIFTAGDEKLLNALASQAAVAFQTARQVEERERLLRQQIQALRVEIDEIKKQRQVAAITSTDYFAHLQATAQRMRQEFEEET